MNNLLVIKIGGGSGLNLKACIDDIARIARHRPVVIVHGVSARMNALCKELGHPIRTLTSPSGHESRYTDASTRDLFVQAASEVNKQIVDLLQQQGVISYGLAERTPIVGERKRAIRAMVDGRIRVVRDDFSGQITSVRTENLQQSLNRGAVAVAPPFADSHDGYLNVDGDRAAAAIAGALYASELMIFTNVRGLYRQFPDEDTFASRVTMDRIENAIDWAHGRMKRKVIAARDALDTGVSRVIIGDGRIENPVQYALNGNGTEFLR